MAWITIGQCNSALLINGVGTTSPAMYEGGMNKAVFEATQSLFN